MRGSTRARRLDAQEPLPVGARHPASSAPVAVRAGAAGELDLGSRIALAADLQAAAGNAATAAFLGEIRTDHELAPEKGIQDLMALKVSGQRGLTRATHDSTRTPLFRIERPQLTGGTYAAKAKAPRLPSLDQEVWWPGPGLHLIRPLGKGNQRLEVTQDWSDRILEGENEHVADNERAYELTWGTVARVLAEMADAGPYAGASEEDVLKAAWADFKRRLPAQLRPDGDKPTREAQEARWGIDAKTSAYAKLMGESKRVRDDTNQHTPLQVLKEHRGADQIDELMDGQSKIPGPKSAQVMQEAWDRLAKS
jgi:hypothetical protein